MALNAAGALTQYRTAIDWLASVDEGVSATGTNHATGYDITKHYTRVTGGTATTADHLALPEFATLTYQDEFLIVNDSSITLYVIPEAGDDIGGGAGVAVSISAGNFLVVKVLSTAASGVGKVVKSEDAVNVNFITGNETLPRNEMFGYVHYVTSAATVTLPAVEAGMNAVFHTIGAIAVSIDPNASDLIYLDGTALDDGDKITNASTAGDTASIAYYDATGWYASTNGWTDGGA